MLFLHEDTLARTLAYDQEVQRWRIAELEAGQDDLDRMILADNRPTR